MRKYELLLDDKKEIEGKTLYRIRALIEIGDQVKIGDIGGYIEYERNLSHSGNAWVFGNACVYENAWVYGNARVYGNAIVCGDALVLGSSQVSDNARVHGNAWVFDNARVSGSARVSGNTHVRGDAKISKNHEVLNITNLKFNLTFTPQNVYGGCRLFTHEEFKNLSPEDCLSQWISGELENYKAFQDLYLKQLKIYKGC